MIIRHNTVAVPIGNVVLGGNSPVVVQSMTNTNTEDIAATVAQIIQLHQAGSELVRITVNTEKAAKAVAEIVNRLQQQQITVPLVGDFHFNGHQLLEKYPDCAQALQKYRINPGNVGSGASAGGRFERMIEIAIKYNKAVRIGVNWGSMDQKLVAKMMDQNNQASQPKSNTQMIQDIMLTSALDNANKARQIGLPQEKIILSCKMSRVQDLVAVYQALAQQSNYALHLGLTEAGMGDKGVISSTTALAILLQQGIGDTIRISLTPEPHASRTREVKVAQEILQALGLRHFMPAVIACPGCGRTSSTLFQQMAQDIESYIAQQMPLWKQQYQGVEKMNVAVMGCIVNGPGESKHANIGISLPGNGENPSAPVYIDGIKSATLKGDKITEQFKDILNNYVQTKYV